jgi:hypothetical protein
MICLNIVVRADPLTLSPCRIAIVRAVLLSCPLVMIPCGSGTIAPSYKKILTQALAASSAQTFPFKNKIRLARALDGLNQFRIRGVSKVADLPANGLLPRGQGFDIDVHPRVRVVSRHGLFVLPRF